MNTPEKINKGLECCFSPEGCEACPYHDDFIECLADKLKDDIVAYIQQLESTVSEKEKVIAELLEKIEQLKRERDAATRKKIPQKVEHKATLYRCGTCPSCGNVVSAYEKWGETFVRIENKYCHFCGQHLDWDGFSEQPSKEEAK